MILFYQQFLSDNCHSSGPTSVILWTNDVLTDSATKYLITLLYNNIFPRQFFASSCIVSFNSALVLNVYGSLLLAMKYCIKVVDSAGLDSTTELHHRLHEYRNTKTRFFYNIHPNRLAAPLVVCIQSISFLTILIFFIFQCVIS